MTAMDNNQQEQMRAAFERELDKRGWRKDHSILYGESTSGNGDIRNGRVVYIHARVQEMWEVWQAATSTHAEQIKRLQADIDRWRARCTAAENGHPQVKQLQDALREAREAMLSDEPCDVNKSLCTIRTLLGDV